MSATDDGSSPTKLSDSQFELCLRVALRYLQTNPRIRNRDIRKVAGIGYDQAIYFFNRAIAKRLLVREGAGSGTCYVLPTKPGKK